MTQAGGRKTIFITGAGSGIGRASARLFAERGWFVGLYDVSARGLEETQALLPPGSWTSGLFDVRDRHGWSDNVSQFNDATGGKLHVLFNNAGVGRHGWFEDVPQDDADWIVDVNLKGVINGVYAALPLLRQTPGARIVNTASTAGVVGAPRLAVYSASKFAVRGLTEALDAEFAGLGVRVVCLTPWFVDTPILDMGATATANVTMADQLRGANMTVYPVELAAEKAWEAAHGAEQVYPVGKEAERARFAARFFPRGLRKQLIAGLPKR